MPPRLIVTRWLWLLCSFQGPPRRRWAQTIGTRADRLGTGLSKLNSMLGLKLGVSAARREAPRPLAQCETTAGPARSGRRSSCTVGVRRWRPRRRKATIFRTAPCRTRPIQGLPRKEVIQPHLPVRLPCYDFTPVTSPTFDGSLPQGVRPPASGVAHSRGVTGGVYKARERIHRGSADPRLLATPPSCRRVSACNPNRDAL